MSFPGPFNLASGGLSAASPLITNCSNLPFGTQGRSWRLESCLQEMGDKKASMPGSPTGPCSASGSPFCQLPAMWPWANPNLVDACVKYGNGNTTVVSGGLSLQRLEAGFWVQPETEVGPGQWEHRILATRPAVSDRPWPFGFAEKNPHKDGKSWNK